MEDEKNVNEEKKLNDNVEQNVTPKAEENGEKIQEKSDNFIDFPKTKKGRGEKRRNFTGKSEKKIKKI